MGLSCMFQPPFIAIRCFEPNENYNVYSKEKRNVQCVFFTQLNAILEWLHIFHRLYSCFHYSDAAHGSWLFHNNKCCFEPIMFNDALVMIPNSTTSNEVISRLLRP